MLRKQTNKKPLHLDVKRLHCEPKPKKNVRQPGAEANAKENAQI